MGIGEAGLGDLNDWVGFSVSIVVYQKKETQNDIDRKRFSTYPVINKFPSVSNLDRYLNQKINQRVTVPPSRTRESV